MAQFLSVTLDDGTSVLYETEEAGLVEKRGGKPGVKEVDPQLSKLESIAHQAGTLCSTLRQRMSPDEISLELGATLSGEVGWFIAKSSLEGSVKITVAWKALNDSGRERATLA